MWLRYLKPRCASALVQEVETRRIQQLLDAIAREDGIAPQTLQHIKHFLGGVFRFAIAQGHLHEARLTLLHFAKSKLSQTSTGGPTRSKRLL
jgi:siderophore synthetase component